MTAPHGGPAGRREGQDRSARVPGARAARRHGPGRRRRTRPGRSATSRTTPSGWRHAPRPSTWPRPVLDPVEHIGVGPARPQLLEVVGDGGQAEDARAALAGALAGHVPGDPGRLGDAAGRRRAGRSTMPTPWVAPTAASGPGAYGVASRAGVEPGPAVATDQDGGQGPVGAGPVQDVGDRRAELDLDHPGAANRPGDA